MSAPPRGPRPPISSYDEPIDDSGAEEAEEKRRQRKNAASLPDAAKEALRLRGLGFTVMPLPTNAKSPPPSDWASASKNNPAVFLRNPGTHNYAVLPPPGCFGWDVDKDAPEALGTGRGDSLGVEPPPTLVTVTPNGRHVFYRWPEDLPAPARTHVRQRRHPLAVRRRGTGLSRRTGVGRGAGERVPRDVPPVRLPESGDIADLPREWAQAALSWRAAKAVPLTNGVGPLAEVTEKYTLPEVVPAGMRYEAIRGYTAHLYNRGFSSREMWPLVQTELAPRFTEALSGAELRDRFERAVRDLAARLG